MNQEEKWKPVVNYPEYEVSSLGRIKRVKTQRILKPFFSLNRRRVQLYGADKRSEVLPVLRIVAEAFIGPVTGRLVLHKDGDVRNCAVDNVSLPYLKHKKTKTNANICAASEDANEEAGLELA